MRITDIRPTKGGRFAVFCDDSYAGSLDGETLLHAGFAKGDEISSAAWEEALGEAGLARAKQKALRLLSLRDHASGELVKKLSEDAGEEAAEAAARRMQELGLVDDARFARRYAEELLNRRLFGRERAVCELIRRGIDRVLAEQTVEELAPDPLEQIGRILEKKYPRGLPDEAARRRATALLSRYGYRWDEIRRALTQFRTEDDDAD